MWGAQFSRNRVCGAVVDPLVSHSPAASAPASRVSGLQILRVFPDLASFCPWGTGVAPPSSTSVSSPRAGGEVVFETKCVRI